MRDCKDPAAVVAKATSVEAVEREGGEEEAQVQEEKKKKKKKQE